MAFNFSKYSGCGNDFILIDDRASTFPVDDKALICRLCNRQLGIGADGIVLLQKGKKGDYGMRIFNSDGSEAEMCGNGLRCLGRFIADLGETRTTFTVDSMLRQHEIKLIKDNVQASMGPPQFIEKDIPLSIEGRTLATYFLDTGVPHAVLFVDRLDQVDVKRFGAKIRHHEHFAPRGANANFVQKLSDSKLSVRTFERGVENETQACGTGVTAAALAAHWKWGLKAPLTVQTRSKQNLQIDFVSDPTGRITEVYQTGPADMIFKGHTVNWKESHGN
jgi:diaminopimelate epimerase